MRLLYKYYQNKLSNIDKNKKRKILPLFIFTKE